MKKGNNNTNFVKLYKQFVYKYVLKLIGEVVEDEIDEVFIDCMDDCEKFEAVSYNKLEKELFFGIKNKKMFKLYLSNTITDDDEKLLSCIVSKYFKISLYHYDGRKRYNYISKTHENLNYEYAVQSGICNWVIGDEKKLDKIENLFNILESWASKTYEGKNVSYGIVINTANNEKDEEFADFGSFLDFLNDEFSAVLTDPITSVFEISANCKLLKYRTIIDENCNNYVGGYELINNLPYRFANIISKTVDSSKKVGVFLLSNGDVILSKNKQILFVKRNSHWLNFNIKAFNNSIKQFVDEYNISQRLIDEIFSSALDVSFTHTGGIIALIPEEEDILLKNGVGILDRCDYISSDETVFQLEQYLKDENEKKDIKKQLNAKNLKIDIDKKIVKRSVIKKLINNEYNFIKINRKLRSELISLDGACIVNVNGKVCSFGAIIQNDSGSTGGGRGAAAKKLSTDGMAIKISTDGYIEVYLKQRKVYVIK